MNVSELPRNTFLYKNGFRYGIRVDNKTLFWKINLALQKYHGNGFVYSWYDTINQYQQGPNTGIPVIPKGVRWAITQFEPGQSAVDSPSYIGVREESDLMIPLIYATTHSDWQSTIDSLRLTPSPTSCTIASVETMIELQLQK